MSAWPRLRPVLVGVLLLVDATVVASLALARPRGWVPPLIAFSLILLGLFGLEAWAVGHRDDDAPAGAPRDSD